MCEAEDVLLNFFLTKTVVVKLVSQMSCRFSGIRYTECEVLESRLLYLCNYEIPCNSNAFFWLLLKHLLQNQLY